MRLHRQQRGAALLVVLVLVFSLATIAVAITSFTDRATRQVAGAQMRDRAYWAMLGAERAALSLLEAQALERENVDLPTERWLSAPFTLPFEGAVIEARFRDVSACFNVNKFVENADGRLRTNEPAVIRFGQLIAQMGGDPRDGETLGTAAADFMDSDGDAGPGGAEDYAYTRGDAPYRTAGTQLADLSELRAVRGWSAELMVGLAPILCARQSGETGRINLNTLTEADAPILTNALDDRIPVGQAERLINERPPDGYENVEQFTSLPVFENLDPPLEGDVTDRLSTEATMIELSTLIRHDGIEFELTSLIEKGTGSGYRVVSRRFGPEN